MTTLIKTGSTLLVALLCICTANAVPAYPYPVKLHQPDGTTLTVVMKGDEYHKYYVTGDGLLITKNGDGVFEYARLTADGATVSSGVKASDAENRSVAERSFVSELNHAPDMTYANRQARAKRSKPAKASSPRSNFPKKGTPRSLVILVNFSDLSFVTPDPRQAFTDLLNQEGYSANGATGSARDYFRDNTMGELIPQFDVAGPYTLPQPYKYYGENDTEDNDKNPVQMIVDACKAAKDGGIDFTTYDTDNDGIVDNVFVYYAGHNEAEWAIANTVWPHRWGIYPVAMFGAADGNYTGTVASVTFDGKRVEDYACTSELKGSSGKSMCGIGTFTHEFGHVLGLADMYATDGGEHFTLSEWCIMDAGGYNNEGRTPPAYNSFERFQLGYITPQLISEQNDIVLNPLLSHNEAALVSSTDTHNLNGENPLPNEFFLLENRQKTGWDAFLPGHGMLIYRINYNKKAFDYNEPNNDPKKMAVEIVPADGIASDYTMSGDPFPGTKNVTSYQFALRSKVLLDKKVQDITETDGVIRFSVKKPLGIPSVPTDAKTVAADEESFTATWDAVNGAESYLLNIYTKTESSGIETKLTENFDKFTVGKPNGSAASTDVSLQLNDYTAVSGWKGEKIYQAGGSVKVGSSSGLGHISTPALDLSASEGSFTLNFDAMAWSGDDKQLKIYLNGQLTHTVTDLGNTADYIFTSYSLPFAGGGASTVIRFEGNKASKSRFFLDNIVVQQGADGEKIHVPNSPFTVSEATTYRPAGIDANVNYYYTVAAMRGTDVSLLSKEVGPISLVKTGINTVNFGDLEVRVMNGKAVFRATAGETVEIYNALGQRVYTAPATDGQNEAPVSVKGVIIVKVGNRVGKVIL